MVFNKGVDTIGQQVAAERAAASSRGDRLEFLKFESDKPVIVRMLTDGPDIIRVAQHGYAKTKAAPAGSKKWPIGITGVCREDAQFFEPDGTPLFADGCYICRNKVPNAQRTTEFAKPTQRCYAVAVLRQQVLGDGSPERGGPERKGKVVGYADVVEKYEIRDDKGVVTGEGKRPKIVLINQAWNNFFAGLAHFHSVYGTLTDRDYQITKTGSGLEVKYPSAPLVETPNLKPGTEAWNRYEKVLADRKIDLEEVVMNMANDEWYARWFDPTKTVLKDGKVVAAGSAEALAEQQAAATENTESVGAEGFDSTSDFEPVDAETQAKMAALKDRVMGTTSA